MGFRVYHLLVKRRGFLQEVALQMTQEIPAKADWPVTPLTQERIAELQELGAIYLNEIRQRTNCVVDVGDYIRLHADPRRFPLSLTQWSRHIVHEDEQFVVINKPSGVPVHAMVDNSVENVIYQNLIQSNVAWLVTHRLDVATQGLVVYGKTRPFQARFNKLLREGRLEKIYSALTRHPVAVGLHVHFMEPTLRAPRKLQAHEFEGALKCALEVVSSVQLQPEVFENRIRLLTGRTHQIRCQLAFLGAPILGDKLYGSHVLWKNGPDEHIALQCSELSFMDSSQNWNFSLPPENLRIHLPAASDVGL